MVQARAKALTDDEKAIASLSESCTTYNDLNLPRGPSQFRKHLDEELLARHHLLTPSQYVYSQPEHRKPPQGILRHALVCLFLLVQVVVVVVVVVVFVVDAMVNVMLAQYK